MSFPLPTNENSRLRILRDYQILDTPPEAAFERITALAARLLDVPIALVSLVDEERQWFKSARGLDVRELPRKISFCTHAILSDEVFVVPDATRDPRFVENPLVTGPMGLRFYAGAPLCTPDGDHRLGALCVIDLKPRELDDAGRRTLRDLAAIVVDELELHRETRRRRQAEADLAREHAALQAAHDTLEQRVRERTEGLRRAEGALREAHDRLEQRVAERTVELARTNAELRTALGENLRLAAAIDSVSLGVIIVDVHPAARAIVFANPAFTAITGYPRGEILGQECRFLRGEHTDPEVVARIRAAFAAGEPFADTVRSCRRDGTVFWNELTLNPVRDAAGEVSHFVGLVVDVTARRQAEERLRLLESIVVHSNDAIVVTETRPLDHPGPRILYVNRAFELATGYSEAETFGKTPRILQGPDTSPEARATIRRALKRWKPVRVELINYRKDGSEFWVELNIVPVANEKGWFTHWVSVQRDITERKLVEEALRESQARYERLTANVPGMVYQFVLRADGSMHFPFASDGCRSTFGLEPEAVQRDAAMILGVVPPAERERFVSSIQHSAETLQPWQWEGAVQPPGGGPVRHLQATSRPERLPNGETRWDGLVVDVTERHRANELLRAKEEAERANVAKSEFLSRMSHELRTPLNAILGFGQLLQLEALAPAQRQSVGHILKGGRHLLGLIDEVLDISRIESGHLALATGPVDLASVVQETFDLMRPLGDEHGVTLRVQPFPPGTAAVRADRGRLKQILLNLFSNAIKYNRPGGEAELSCVRVVPPAPGGAAGREAGGGDQCLRLSVRDTGLGIAPAGIPKLFVPFERLDAVHSSIEGTGLGLAVSKHLVEAMGGAIGVESAPGTGSTFWVELPVAVVPPEPWSAGAAGAAGLDAGEKAGPSAPGGSAPGAEPSPFTPWVLYVEDNVSNRRLIQSLFERQRPDWRLLSAENGAQGLEMARTSQPDLILLDLQLPDMPGDAVLEQLRTDPLTGSIPVILLSADANPQSSARLLAAGARAYLTKPMDVPSLFAAVEEALASAGSGKAPAGVTSPRSGADHR